MTFRIGHNYLSIVCPYQMFSNKPVLLRKMGDVLRTLSKPCPPPLKGKKASITTVGNTPFVLARPKPDPNDKTKKIGVVEKDPKTGNLLGVDNEISSLLCQGLQCESYSLSVPSSNRFDQYSAKDKKRKGRTGELLAGKADFALGFPTAPRQAYMRLSITGYSNNVYCSFQTTGF